MTAAQRIAEAIRAEYPCEQLTGELAEQLMAAAKERWPTWPTWESALMLWIGDRPGHEISAADFARWTERNFNAPNRHHHRR